MRLLSEEIIQQLLTSELAIESAIEAYTAFSTGRAKVPLRTEIYRDNPSGRTLIMPALIEPEVLGVKIGGHVLDAGDSAKKYTNGMMLIWDGRTLQPRGLLATDRLNDYRTAAGLAIATRVLARPDARIHAIFGAGKLSFPSALYIGQVRTFEKLILVGRTLSRVEALAEQLLAMPDFADVSIEIGCTADEAARAADVITMVTNSETPLFDGSNIRPGTHLNLGGANTAKKRELDDAGARKALFYVDSLESCRAGAGDVRIPLEAGVIKQGQIQGEIGMVLNGQLAGRREPGEITAFKSMGIATQDIVLGAALLDRAETLGLGETFDFRRG